MHRANLPNLLAIALLPAALACASDAHAQATDATAVRYTVKLLKHDLGAKPTTGYSINNLGWVAGRANTTAGARHGILWRDRHPTDLGTLGTRADQSSFVRWPVKNTIGMLSGISHTDRVDPLGEAFSCGAFMPNPGGYVCRGFVWRNDAMRELPTFGGPDTHGFATGTNNRGLTVGWAEFDALDASCLPGNDFNQQRRFSAALWGPEAARIRELPPLPGHSASAATAINDRGQVVGISGICDQGVGRDTALEAVLWENGVPRAIGHLPGNGWHTPNMINQAGVVVGFSAYDPSLPSSEAKTQGFIWRDAAGVAPIAFLPGDDDASANSINNRNQVVGMSCGGGGCRAFVWQDGRIADLNALRQPGASSIARLVSANDIDDLGRITGQATYRPKGASADVTIAFVATPVDAD